MENIIFELPVSVSLPRVKTKDKKMMLNMNSYRNLNFHINNQMKQLFEPISITKFKASKIRISYKIYKKTKRKYDVMNVASIVDKFFLDWLIKYNFIPDDNLENVCYGSIDGYNDSIEDKVITEIEILFP